MKTRTFELTDGTVLVITGAQELSTARLLAALQHSVVSVLTDEGSMQQALPAYREFAANGFAEIVEAVMARRDAHKQAAYAIEERQKSLAADLAAQHQSERELAEQLAQFGEPLALKSPQPPSQPSESTGAAETNGVRPRLTVEERARAAAAQKLTSGRAATAAASAPLHS